MVATTANTRSGLSFMDIATAEREGRGGNVSHLRRAERHLVSGLHVSTLWRGRIFKFWAIFGEWGWFFLWHLGIKELGTGSWTCFPLNKLSIKHIYRII